MDEKLKKNLKDKRWRMEHLYYIINEKSELVKFKFRPFQEILFNNEWLRIILLKARQGGYTTFFIIDMLDEVLFNSHYNAVCIAHEEKAQQKIFEKVTIAWDNMNEDLKRIMGWRLKVERASQYTFNNDSTIKVALSTRSETVNYLHISEFGKICAKYPEKSKEVISGAIPSVTQNGKIVIESTAEGEFGKYYDMFWDSWGKKLMSQKEFKAFFFAWFDNSKYVDSCNVELSKETLEMGNKFNLKREQLNWYELEKKIQKKMMCQEYPCTPDEAFLSSGTKWFTKESLEFQVNNLMEGNKEGEFTTIFEEYKLGKIYAIGCDIAEGVGQDSNTIVVMNFSENIPYVVAIYKNNHIAPDVFAYEIKNLAIRYGSCIVGIERNNHGITTIDTIKHIYSYLYKEIRTNKQRDEQTEKLGWHTNFSTKTKMMSQLKTALNDEAINIISKELLQEIRTYDQNDLSVTRFNPDQTKHWDLLIALAICYQMRNNIRRNGSSIPTIIRKIKKSHSSFKP